jgi:hypothetical protein
MKWKQKALIQNLIAKLPPKLSYSTYYFVQRKFGGLKEAKPVHQLQAAAKINQLIHQRGETVQDKTFLEVGTGRRVALPLGLWLCGAGQIVTVDLNPYLKSELVLGDIDFIRNLEMVRNWFEPYANEAIFNQRLERLFEAQADLSTVLKLMNIEYLAPADATHLPLSDKSVDYHVSHTVFEHIPAEVLEGIVAEGQRILKRNGSFIHCIDFSDHFSHSDSSISAIHFLQYNEREWARYAGNRYMYHNRMRVDDFISLFTEPGLEIETLQPTVDERSLRELENGFPLDEQFQGNTKEVNATVNAWFVVQVVQ